MHLTYELYFHPVEGAAVFEPLTCAREADLLAQVRALLLERKMRSVEVHHLGAHLFTLDAGSGR